MTAGPELTAEHAHHSGTQGSGTEGNGTQGGGTRGAAATADHPTATATSNAPSGATAEPVVQVENVYKVFGRKPQEAVRHLKKGATRAEVATLGTAAVIDASFEVAEGEIFVVMGLSGSGKSTLIRMLNGLWKPTSGHIRIGGDDLSTVSTKKLRSIRQRSVSMVFQHFALLPHRTVLDNAAYPLEIQGIAKEERLERARQALDLVGLTDWADRLPSQLSGGMRQRVGLARALAADTDVLLMDEAFSALDPLIRREMQEQLVDLQNKLGKTIIFITHDLNEAMFLGDRIAVMRDGEIVQIGTSEQILSDPANEYVAQFVADVDRTRVLTASSLMTRPAAVAYLGGGPRQASRTMREEQVVAAYVVDRGRRFCGVVYDDEAVVAARDGVTSLSGLVRDDLTAVTPDTPLSEIFGPSAGSTLPVPVVCDEGRLLGVVPRVALLEAMVRQTTDEGEDETSDEDSGARNKDGGSPDDDSGAPDKDGGSSDEDTEMPTATPGAHP